MPKTVKPNDWKEEWNEMPSYDNIVQEQPLITATFKFRSQEDFDEFLEKIREHVFDGMRPFDGIQRKEVKSTWYPHNPQPKYFAYVENDGA